MILSYKIMPEADLKFETIYENYADGIYRFVYYKVFNPGIAEDLTADSFMKAYEKYNTFDPEKASISTWLYTIARNTVIDYFRKSKPELHTSSPVEDIWDLASTEKVDIIIEQKETVKELQTAMKQLSNNEREIVLMRIWDNLSYKEISKRLGKSPEALKMSYSRIVKKMQKLMNVLLSVLSSLIIQGNANETF